jgi:uncharacterized radical SAM superfamily protein
VQNSLNSPNPIADPDASYRRLIEAHRGLSDDESTALNARLILVLMDRIGDQNVIAEAIRIAVEAGQKPERKGVGV